MSISAPASLDRSTFSICLSDEPERTRGRTEIDLSSVRFVDAHALVGIALQIDAAQSAGHSVRMVMPQSSGVTSYLARMGLRDYMKSVGFRGRELPEVNRRDLHHRLSELQLCRLEGDYEAVADLVYRKIQERGYYPELANVVYESIMELGNNVLEHAACGHGFTAAQTYQYGQADEYLVFAVGDAGIGLRSSLTRTRQVADDHEAAALAIQEGVSGTGDQARGYGLPSIVSSSIDLGGDTLLTSGSATLRVNRWSNTPTNSSHLIGTIVGSRIRCHPGL